MREQVSVDREAARTEHKTAVMVIHPGRRKPTRDEEAFAMRRRGPQCEGFHRGSGIRTGAY